MYFHQVKHNVIIFFCTLFLINGCNQDKKKLIVEKNEIIETTKKNDQAPSNKKIITNKILKKELIQKDHSVSKKINNNNVIFEFRNERLLQGRNIENNIEQKKTKKALSAVMKMLQKNLSTNNDELNLTNTNNISDFDEYYFEEMESSNYKNIVAFLPLTGKYSNFGNKIRKALDLSILNFGPSNAKIIYFDTGKVFDQEIIANFFERMNPKFVIGPFTREVLLKIKPLAKNKSLPILSFSNDIAMIENNVWSLGFSPEEQVESVISCALMHGYRRFGIIAPDNLYGQIITRQSIDLVSTNKNNLYESIYLSNKQINNKTKLYSTLRKFLEYSEKQDSHEKFDSILLGGRKEFVLEIAPLLAFFNVDSRKIKILGTEIFDNKEIKNEPSLEKSWFPIISSKNDDQFKFLLKSVWGVNNNYFSNAGFDSGIIGIDFIKNKNHALKFLKNVEGPVTGLIFDTNGYVKKPIHVMQIEDLGKLTNIEKCRKFKD